MFYCDKVSAVSELDCMSEKNEISLAVQKVFFLLILNASSIELLLLSTASSIYRLKIITALRVFERVRIF